MSTVLFDLDDFEETRTEWEPVWEPTIEDFGWHWPPVSLVGSALHRDGKPVTKAEWKIYLDAARCRDCGRRCAMNQGGAGEGHGFRVCDDCAQLDGCLTRKHDRGPDWHVSHWGDSHPAADHDRLVKAQAKRRAAYLRRAAA